MENEMGESRGGILASKIAETVGGTIVGADFVVFGPCSIDRPRAEALTFVKTVERLQAASSLTNETVVIAPLAARGLTEATLILVEKPRQAFAVALTSHFAPTKPVGIAKTAQISPSARIGKNVSIGDFTVVGPDAWIGDYTEVRHRVTIAARVRIGSHCLLKSGAVVGEEGHGFEKDDSGHNLRFPHSGSVVIHDHVEIGANTVVCGGTIEPTVIEDHVKIDDQVFVAHNCRIGRNAIVIACAEISGSVDVGEGAWIGPNATIINGLKIGAGAYIGGGAAVIRDCEPGMVYAGVPARPLRERRASDG
jgi:UDP-3-O-[3-hydroxymyristoyl] glucosamine N-acyltransferase